MFSPTTVRIDVGCTVVTPVASSLTTIRIEMGAAGVLGLGVLREVA